MTEATHRGDAVVVLGVTPRTPVEVIRTAVTFARPLAAEIVCGSVDESDYAMEATTDPVILNRQPINSDLNHPAAPFDAALHATLSREFDEAGVRWKARALAGEAAHRLHLLAEELDAMAIIVGAPASHGESLHERFVGSVATRLAHRQHRPVIVVPLPGTLTYPSTVA